MQGNIIRLNKMMKKIAVVFMTATIFVVLAGCGEEKKDITSIKIDRKGNITSVIYDDFAGENYSQEEFETAISEALSLNEPIVIDCRIASDDKVWPMVAPGAPIQDCFDDGDR